METVENIADYLASISESKGCPAFSKEFAQALDAEDTLSRFRSEFLIPKMSDLPSVEVSDIGDISGDREAVYLCGHSLGLQPKRLKREMQLLLDDWGKYGAHGRVHGHNPWEHIDEHIQRLIADIVGALPHEVAVMNGLTVNLHLLLISFYRPTPQRYKILLEEKAFPSDHYAFESQVCQRGYEPDDALIFLSPRAGEHYLRTEDILQVIKDHGHEIQVICLPGIQYFTGQLFDIPAITAAGHEVGAYVGWDMAHTIGNVELKLHDWNVDFAVWCHYKYISGGAGAIGGAFLHQKHVNSNLPRLQGWWGHRMATRFRMDNKMDSSPGIAGYRLSCPCAIGCLPVKVAAELILQAGLDRLIKKSHLLTGYLEYLLMKELKCNDGASNVEIRTSRDFKERGSMLSLRFKQNGTEVFKKLTNRGVVSDFRMPDAIRVAPVPIYNSFVDIYNFVLHLKDITNEC